MAIAVLIGIMISIVVAVSLIPIIMESVDKAQGTAPEEARVISILPIVIVVVIILGAVAWIAGVEGFPSPWKMKRRRVEKDSESIPRPIGIPFYKTRLFWRILLIGGAIAVIMSLRSIFTY